MDNTIARRGFWLAGGLLLASPMLALAFWNLSPERDPLWMQFDVHFWVVGFTAIGAAIASAIIVASAKTLRETRLLFLALAFISIGGIFSIHGLMTPGYIAHEFYLTVPLSGWISIIVGGDLRRAERGRAPWTGRNASSSARASSSSPGRWSASAHTCS